MRDTHRWLLRGLPWFRREAEAPGPCRLPIAYLYSPSHPLVSSTYPEFRLVSRLLFTTSACMLPGPRYWGSYWKVSCKCTGIKHRRRGLAGQYARHT
eukprot:jgi/Botrbrau1/12193/Bobra.0186s0099.1